MTLGTTGGGADTAPFTGSGAGTGQSADAPNPLDRACVPTPDTVGRAVRPVRDPFATGQADAVVDGLTWRRTPTARGANLVGPDTDLKGDTVIYHHAIGDAVARAHVTTLLVQAEADRRAAPLAGRRGHRPRWWPPRAWSWPTGPATTSPSRDGSRPTRAGGAPEIDGQLRPDVALAELL
jgi:hypothetical protein